MSEWSCPTCAGLQWQCDGSCAREDALLLDHEAQEAWAWEARLADADDPWAPFPEPAE